MVTPADAPAHESIFKWETMTAIAVDDLQLQRQSIAGMMYEIELTSGRTVRVWRSNDGQHYFCHGLTFGGKEATGGAVSPYTGKPVETIIQEHFRMIPETASRAGDILVWRGIAPESTPHSAILTSPIVVPGKNLLDTTTTVQTKNGLSPETNMTLEELIVIYGESYNAYRRQ